MLLLCQEFKIDDVLRLWDTLLADPSPSKEEGGRFSFNKYVCAALTISVREEIIDKNDFGISMECLQKVGASFQNANILINLAIDIYMKFVKY